MASTLPPTTPQEEDERYNTGQQLWDKEVGSTSGFSDREKQALSDKAITDGMESQFEDPTDTIRKQENASSPINFEPTDTKKKSKTRVVGRVGKRAAPSLVAIIAFLFGGIGLTAFFTPSILLVQVKEMFVSKLDRQIGAMDPRAAAVVKSKIKGTTVGCGKLSIIKCKYTSMSKYQIEKLKLAGVNIETDKSIVQGYSKIKSMNYKGITVTAEGFDQLRKVDSNFHAAITKSYDPRLYGNADYKFKALAATLGLSKASNGLENATSDEDRDKAVKDTTKSGNKTATSVKVDAECDKNGECDTGENKKTSQADLDNAEKTAGSINDTAKQVAESGDKQTSKLIGALGGGLKNAGSAIGGFLRLDQAVADVCSVRGSLLAVGYAAKTVRAIQYARYAMIFLTTADMIKAGTAKAEDVSYLGNVITKTTRDSNGNVSLSGTDSAGYKYAADNDTSGFDADSNDQTVSQSLIGGGLSGSLVVIARQIENVLGGHASAKATCGTVLNPWFSAGSAVVGLAVMLIPGGQAVSATKLAASAAANIALGVAMAMLPAMLSDIVAGVAVDSSTYGAASTNIIASGTDYIQGRACQTGGCAPLTVDQAKEVDQQNQQVAAAYAADDRLAYSPLDATNSNTFMGTIARQLLPLTGNMSSIAGGISSFASLASQSVSSALLPGLHAATNVDQYNNTTDEDYQAIGLATDALGGAVFGLPAKYQNLDPGDVIDRLGNQIDQTTGEPTPGSDYETFVNKCMSRQSGSDAVPLGYDDDSGLGDGSECMLTDENIAKNPLIPYYYVHSVDQRVRNGMDDEEPAVGGADDSTNDSPSADGSVPVSSIPNTCSGKEQTGSGIKSYSDLSGSPFDTRVNSAGASSIVSLPAGSYTFSNFSSSNKGAQFKIAGLVGTGTDTVLSMKANTSNKASQVPTASPQTNQFYLIGFGSETKKLDCFTLKGTDQGHLYNGMVVRGASGAAFSNLLISNASPGNNHYPPGETFAINDFHGNSNTYKNVEIDGGNTGASGFGLNSTNGGVWDHSSAHDLKYSIGWAFWQQTGGATITDSSTINNRGGVNFERATGTYNLVRMKFGGNSSSDISGGTDQDGDNFHVIVTDPILVGQSKIKVGWFKTEAGVPNKYGKKNIKVIVNGVDKTDSMIQWTGVGAG